MVINVRNDLKILIRKLTVNKPAFNDKSNWVITDIPPSFDGIDRLEFDYNDYTRQEVNFEVNVDSIIYVAFDPIYITLDPELGFTDTRQVISVVDVAKGSIRYVVDSRTFNAGSVYFKFSNKSSSFLSLMVFTRIDTTRTIESSCGGNTSIVDGSAKDLVACNASSTKGNSSCSAAFPVYS